MEGFLKSYIVLNIPLFRDSIGDMKRLHHIAIVVDNLEEIIGKYGDGLDIGGISVDEVPSQGVYRAMCSLDNSMIEFVSPLGDNSPVSRFLEKTGGGLHHICLEVDNLEAAIKGAKDAGFRTIGEKPSPIGHGLEAIFLHPASSGGVLLELVAKLETDPDIRSG